MNIPIVIAAYNRAHTLSRLLSSLAKGNYPDPVKLIISIDSGGPDSVKAVANDFHWEFGPKQVIDQPENLGLRNHILFCGDITSQYDGIILLEDDLYVSPWFYKYTVAALDFYSACKDVCGVSLYSYLYNETAYLPFKPLNDGSDVYFMQLPCSWGQAWLKEDWAAFRKWYDLNASSSFQDDPTLPPNIAFWPATSWKKYFLKYMVEHNKFFIYPHISQTTNFGDKGQHHQGTNVFQVPISVGDCESYFFRSFEDCLIKYDAFCELLPESLLKLCRWPLPENLSVDLYGSKGIENIRSEYVVTSKRSSSYAESFGRRMVPQELNIINQIQGDDFIVARVDSLELDSDINHFLHERAADPVEQRYFFSTDEVHSSRLEATEIRLEHAETIIGSNSELSTYLQQVEKAASNNAARIQALESSLSWRLTKPLRRLVDRFRV